MGCPDASEQPCCVSAGSKAEKGATGPPLGQAQAEHMGWEHLNLEVLFCDG